MTSGDNSARDQLDINPLINAVERLNGLIQRWEGLERHRREPDDDQLRGRYLRQVAASPDAFIQMPFQDMIRLGNEQGLLRGDWPAWRLYRDMRARTSHTYAAAVAKQMVNCIPDFLAEATYLRDQLRQRLG
jgi:Nucleotidyltransferase substrate binding protein like